MSSKSSTHDFDDEFEVESSSAEQIDLQHYVRLLRKNKWPITFFTALVTVLAAYYAYTATPIYRSSSTLLIESQKANILSIEELYGVEKESGDYYQTQYEILRSRALAIRVVQRLGLDDAEAAASQSLQAESTSVAQTPVSQAPEGFHSQISAIFQSLISKVGLGGAAVDSTDNTTDTTTLAANTDSAVAVEELSVNAPNSTANAPAADDREFDQNLIRAVARFRSNLSIDPVRKTKLVKIGYASPDREYAALVANVVAEEYILSVLDGRMRLKEQASNWMNERVAVLKAKLDESEQRLIDFKQQNGLIDVNGSVGRLNEQELLLATTELAQARSELSNAQDLYREVRSIQRTSPELLKTVPAIQNDPLVRSVEIEFGQRQRELDELSNRYGSKHPRIIDAQSRLDSLQSTLNGHIQRVVGTIQKDYQLRRQRVSAIQNTLSQGKENIQIIGQKKFKLDALEREVATNRDIYSQFFSRITETNSSDGLDEANARISDYAVPAARPFKPKKQLIIALAMLASLVLSVLLAFLYEQLDESIKSTHDVEAKLGVKFLGILPLINKGLLGVKKELPLNPTEIVDKKGTFAESVNTARTALSLKGDSDNKIILITSSVPGEGKSTSALNLAYSFSQLERVLLIDCDMRRPSLAKAINLNKNASGLSSLITNAASAQECIRRNAIGALDIMTSGPIPQQPLELISSSRFRKIVEKLSVHYDRIIIDSAPTQAVSDAIVLSKLADAVVYVVKSHATSYNLVKRGIGRLQQTNASVAGVLMTQVDIEKISSYGGDYYYQGYYDYYGYTDKSQRKGKKGEKIRLTPDELRTMKLDDEDVELDLGDYVRAAPVRRNQVRSNNDVYDEEFDLTTEVSSTRTRSRQATTTQAGGYSNDLDLV